MSLCRRIGSSTAIGSGAAGVLSYTAAAGVSLLIGAGEVGDAGCRTGEIGLSVKPNDARLGVSAEAAGVPSAGPPTGMPAGAGGLPLNHDEPLASGRAGGRR